ncbi:pathogenesis-related protein STH-21-like [Cryptomeria japonica]|uniref:pathogenesis-related protein STH-21-like n=1 Tax=Cryptomeria japonica TaxID=3369 RepID=UPI0027D9E76B|nr:pathogenesis-related protein STH-21-like [Cryptomeria japonica]
MVAGSFSIEIESPVEAKRLWKATVDTHNLLPKQAPALVLFKVMEELAPFDTLSSLQRHCLLLIIRYEIKIVIAANKDFSYMKEKVDLVDEANLVYGYSPVEGGMLGEKVASVSHKIKYTLKPEGNGGCITTFTCDYDNLPGVPQDEAKIEEIKAKNTGLFKQVEEYLIANPTLYC